MKVQVLLPKIFNYPFTYNSKDINPKIGDLVEVPFGSKKEYGVVWKSTYSVPEKIKIKEVIRKVHEYSIDKSLINFIEWFSIYNLVPIGLVLKMVIGNKDSFFKNHNEEIKIQNTKSKKYHLNLEQSAALKFVENISNNFDVSVLEGITGSGKTLVYFERIKKILKKKKQALVLLPEIFLTNEFKNRFEDYFGFEPAVWHSKITPKQKRLIWKGIIKNKIKLVIGARSALLLPFKNLGVIIVDEEHDSSYKQDEGVIYNARDMAISRASFEKIPIHLITSVPSIETYNNIEKKKYRHFKILKRFKDYPLPETKIVNLNISKLKGKFIAPETIKLVDKYLKKKEQILFFINRRGYAPYIVCKKCGFKHICKNCSMYLTFHRLKNKVVCHHCLYERNIKTKCKIDNFCDFKMFGPGVEKIFEELKEIFPKKDINIFSSDYLKKKKETIKLFKKINENKTDIIVGTQMISKGFNFPKLNCIVVIDADFSGRGYDLRSTEKNIQLYHQLSGRAGRFNSESLVIYQSLTSENLILNDIIKNRPDILLKNELVIRKKNNLPPFVRLIAIIVSSKQQKLSLLGAQQIKDKINKKIKGLEILGPVDSPLLKVKKHFRTRLLIKFNNKALLQKKIENLLNNLKISSKIKLTVDVDPVNFA